MLAGLCVFAIESCAVKFQLGSYRSYIYVLIGALATISIAVAVGLWRYNIDQKTFDARYAALTKEFAERIDDRFQLYQYGLRGARGAIVATEELYSVSKKTENESGNYNQLSRPTG